MIHFGSDVMSRIQILCMTILCGMTLAISGCSEGRTYPVNQEVARSSLEQALQAWVEGQKPADLQPGMYVSDPAWDSGKKLEGYEILDDEVTEGSNVHIRVKRKFTQVDGTFDPTVKYIISTSPAISIVPQ